MNTFADSVEITDKVYTILDNTALQTGYPIETYNDGYGPNKFLPIRIMKNDSRSFIVHFGGSCKCFKTISYKTSFPRHQTFRL